MKSHPDYEKFIEFGSPLNFLSRSQGLETLSQKSLNKYYSSSQTAFADLSAASLIKLAKGSYEEIFCDKDPQKISETELNNLEKLYEKITNFRKSITQNTRTVGNVSNDLDILESLSYTESSNKTPTATTLVVNDKYSKYLKSPELHGTLKLKYLIKLFAEEILDSKDETILGEIGVFKNRLAHIMGTYRIEHLDDEKYEFDLDTILKVDIVTAFAAKKAMLTKDKDEALKCAFIFGILRGYNVRSSTGACWAQEMSMRLIFAQKNWQQFKKMPGIYLDIEACLIGNENPEQKLSELIDKMVSDYKISVDPNQTNISSDSLFDKPSAANDQEFKRYLIHTKRYRNEDLGDLISFTDETGKTALEIAAINSYENSKPLSQKPQSALLNEKIEGSVVKISAEPLKPNLEVSAENGK